MSTFTIEVSARHVHLSREAVGILFGPGHTLTFTRALSQPGQFLSEERLDLVSPKTTLRNVAILGPERPATQVELSATDCYALGLPCCLRESGDLQGSPGGLTLIGPCGQIRLEEGIIVAKRHLHMTPEDAAAFQVQDRQIVSIALATSRPVILQDVIIRVHPQAGLAMHIDTDEANAALVPRAGIQGELSK